MQDTSQTGRPPIGNYYSTHLEQQILIISSSGVHFNSKEGGTDPVRYFAPVSTADSNPCDVMLTNGG